MEWFRPKNIHVLKWPKSRSKSYWPSVARLENCCSQTLSIESAWAWAVLQRRMSKHFSLWMCKAGRDIPQRREEEGGSAKYWCRGPEYKTRQTRFDLLKILKTMHLLFLFCATSQLCATLCWSVTENRNKNYVFDCKITKVQDQENQSFSRHCVQLSLCMFWTWCGLKEIQNKFKLALTVLVF